MPVVSLGDSLHEMLNSVYLGKKEIYLKTSAEIFTQNV